jgi:hypothetical protein
MTEPRSRNEGKSASLSGASRAFQSNRNRNAPLKPSQMRAIAAERRPGGAGRRLGRLAVAQIERLYAISATFRIHEGGSRAATPARPASEPPGCARRPGRDDAATGQPLHRSPGAVPAGLASADGCGRFP